MEESIGKTIFFFFFLSHGFPSNIRVFSKAAARLLIYTGLTGFKRTLHSFKQLTFNWWGEILIPANSENHPIFFCVHKDLSLRSYLQTCPLNLVRPHHFWLDTATFPCGTIFCKVPVSFINPGCWVSRNLAIVILQMFLCPQTELTVSQMCLNCSICNIRSLCTHAVYPSGEVLVLQLFRLLVFT